MICGHLNPQETFWLGVTFGMMCGVAVSLVVYEMVTCFTTTRLSQKGDVSVKK